MKPPVPRDPWTPLSALTPARIALGRTGASLPTRAVLAFALDHARARDAVHTPFDAAGLAAQVEALGLATLTVDSAAPDRSTYLRRPDLGRRLSAAGAARIETKIETLDDVGGDIVIVLGDGLSSAAVHAHAAPLLAALLPQAAAAGWRLAPVVLARQARVALGDEIGERLGARMLVMLIGERPGLSSPDSLGAYLTYAPRIGRSDAERNCISNIRPDGLGYAEAAFKIAWHIAQALRLGLTGVGLKDDSGLAGLTGAAPPRLV
jgi:ethanolamine ammonia-lyase small subunit